MNINKIKKKNLPAIRMGRDVNAFVRQHGIKEWINYELADKGHNIRINWSDRAGTLEARVNQGLWVVYCPAPDCENCQIVDDRTPFFFCTTCLNYFYDHKPHYVTFPDMKLLNQLMKVRPDHRKRNFNPVVLRGKDKGKPETIEHLKAENKKYGWEEVKEKGK